MMNANVNDGKEAKGIDLPMERRPGVPMQRMPERVGSAHWMVPEKQVPPPGLTFDAQRGEPTATFGTGQPPRGLSGVMRRAAYRIPDYEPRRWAMLLLADRVDAMEDRLYRVARHPATWVVLLAGIGLVASRRRLT